MKPAFRVVLGVLAGVVSTPELLGRLRDGDPSIHANPSRVHEGIILFGPMCLKDGEPELIGKRLRHLLR